MSSLETTSAVNRFNRNIVECKEQMMVIAWANWNRFNRNIVECKVNSSSVMRSFRYRFNRNIVECKDISFMSFENVKHMI